MAAETHEHIRSRPTMTDDAFSTIRRHGVVPVVTVERLETALPLADALLEGGLPIAEITFRTSVAADVIRLLTEERPELLVGAGTVLSLENLRAAKESGARFGVAPGLNPDVVMEAARLGLPFIPGVATASEIERGLALGSRVLKLFPAALLGGPAFINVISGPFNHTGVQFMPSGGATAETLRDYLACPRVVAVGGTWIAPKELIATSDWSEIRCRAQVAREIVAQARNRTPNLV
jgi:2-dehydro-3-deoxyphosphogluconate aldolase/(4S)-4-hydroxy-2-oxoglutarate aldolase